MTKTPQRQNPVTQAEITHLERSARRGGAQMFTRMLALVLGASLLLGLGLSLMSRSGSLTSVNLRENYAFFSALLRSLNVLLAALLFVTHAVLVWETLLAAADAIAREKRAGAWETLVLTQLTAGQIVGGKWWGVQSFIYRRLAWLIILRLAAALWLIVSSTTETLGVPALIAAFALSLALTALNVALVAALGLVASFSSSILSPIGVALSGYITLFLAYFGAHLLLFNPLTFGATGWNGFATWALALAPLDGGMVLSGQLSSSSDGGYLLGLLSATPVSFALYGLLIVVSLLLARWHAVRHSAA